MKTQKTINISTILMLSALIISLLFTAGCNKQINSDELWKTAIYTEDKTFGDGAKSAYVEVKAGDKSITFTLKTDKENLADALLEHKLVEGEGSQYGLYIKKVNGILADYDINQSYWNLCKDGEALLSGASDTKISDGEHYEFVYTK